MSKSKTVLRITCTILSLIILLTFLPTGVVAVDVQPTATEKGVTIQDVAAGAASIYDLYGEDYVVNIPDTAPTLDPSKENDNRVRQEEGDNLNKIVVDNGDGTHTMTLYSYPVKFVNEKGEIEDISLEVTQAGGGAYKTKANKIHKRCFLKRSPREFRCHMRK